jgi:hypothetical protein
MPVYQDVAVLATFPPYLLIAEAPNSRHDADPSRRRVHHPHSAVRRAVQKLGTVEFKLLEGATERVRSGIQKVKTEMTNTPSIE